MTGLKIGRNREKVFFFHLDLPKYVILALTDHFLINSTSKHKSDLKIRHQTKVSSTIFKNNYVLANPGQNRDVRKILINLIGCLEDLELEKTDFYRKSKPLIGCI